MLTQASGASSFLRQLGGAFGINRSSIYLERQTSLHFMQINETQHAGNNISKEMINGLLPALNQAGLDQSQQLAVAMWVLTKELYRQVFALFFQDTFAITDLVLLVVLLPTAYLSLQRRN